MSKFFSVAIDGPSGAGKSTLAKLCAKELGFLYVDTGALYRTVGLAARNAGISSKNATAVSTLLPEINITMKHDQNGVQRMYLNGEDVTDCIREPDISIFASDVSAMPAVRSFLLDTQRGFAENGNVIMDGRDIGTVVLPQATLKIFLTARPEERAYRRYEELLERGIETTFEEVYSDIQYRDNNDSSRSAAPLKAAEDAIRLDTTGYSLEKSYELICELIREKMNT